MVQQKRIQPGTMRLRVRSLASFRGLRIQHCHCYGSGHCCGASSMPGLGTSAGCGHSQNTQNKNKTITSHLTFSFSTILRKCTPKIRAFNQAKVTILSPVALKTQDVNVTRLLETNYFKFLMSTLKQRN